MATDQDLAGSAIERFGEPTLADDLAVPSAETQSSRAASIGVSALGAFAVGAAAIGACAVGALAINRLTIGKSQIRSLQMGSLEIDELTVRRLRVEELVIEQRGCGAEIAVADQNPEKPMKTYPETYSTALITGASSGIGEAFARLLAAEGSSLILVARSEVKLCVLATELAERHNIRAEVIAVDLSVAGAARRVWEEVKTRRMAVDLLINNAGFGSYGAFDTLALPLETQQISLNITALVELTHLFLPGMLAKKSGAVINVSSTAGFQPVPYMAVYGATKAFVLSFSEALWSEYRSCGIRVLVLCPGATATAFNQVAGLNLPSFGKGAAAASVAAAALKALSQGRSYVVPGGKNYWSSLSSRFAPRAWVAQIGSWMMRPSAPSS